MDGKGVDQDLGRGTATALYFCLQLRLRPAMKTTCMKGPKRRIALLLCVLVLSTSSLHAQKEPDDREKSCLHFAQAFYDWYVAEVFKDFKTNNGRAPWHAALKYKGNPFSRELSRALIESDAEAKADGDPVLNFDPILDSQDPAEHYVVRSVTRKNGRYWAEVYGVWSRPVSDQGKGPQVLAEMTFEDGHWHFVNFHYPNSTHPKNEDLLDILNYQVPP